MSARQRANRRAQQHGAHGEAVSAVLPADARPWLHDTARHIARHLFRPVFRLTVVGADRTPRTGPLVVVANHSTMLEAPLIFGALPRRSVFLTKQELFEGALGAGLRAIGQVPVRRGEPDRAPLTEAVRILRADGVVGVFLEGTRGDGDVANAERGAAWLVRATGATVLPIAVRGTKDVWHHGFRPHVDVLVGEPFTPEIGRGRAGLAAGTDTIRDGLAALVRTLDGVRERRGR